MRQSVESGSLESSEDIYDVQSKGKKRSRITGQYDEPIYSSQNYNSEISEIFCTDWLQPSLLTDEYHAGSLIRLKNSPIKRDITELDILYLPVMSWITAKIGDYGGTVAENASLHLANFIENIERIYASLSTEERGKIIYNKLADLAGSMTGQELAEVDANITLPKVAPKRYFPRQSGKASDFLKEHWGSYIEAGVMFRPDLKRLDPKLEMALRNEFRGRPDELRALLPNQTDAADARLAAEFGAPIRPEDRKAAMVARSITKRLKPPIA